MAQVNKVKVQLKNVRLSFAQLFEKKGYNGSEPAYSANFLIDKHDTDTVDTIKNAIKTLTAVQWPKGDVKLKADKIAFKDGDDVTYQGYADHYFVSAKNRLTPKLKDMELNDLTAEDNKLVSGDWVNAVIEFWAQDNQYGRRINCNLVGVQHIKSGERFGGSGGSDDLFEKSKDAKDDDMNPFSAEPVAPKLKFGAR